ncbi:MAG: hypothetical protein EOO59_10230 [Hymenobacter sp.]|nr:MAG: hypothetical protein EOO59_10230 [Hymenobacter sp.]
MKTACIFAGLCLGLAAYRMHSAAQQPAIEVFPTQNSTLLGVKGPHVAGTIFTADYLFEFPSALTTDSVVRFTPTGPDIAAAEQLAATQLKALNHYHPNQTPGNPVLEKNLPAYFRQYVGYVNRQDEKIIHLNFYWTNYPNADKRKGYSDLRLHYDSPYATTLDGGSYYWQVDANLTKRQLSNLWVNGFG